MNRSKTGAAKRNRAPAAVYGKDRLERGLFLDKSQACKKKHRTSFDLNI
jgi:hypothetical protein